MGKRKISYKTTHKGMLEFDDEMKEASMGFGIKQQMEEADNKKYYYGLPSLEEFTKIVKDVLKKANNEESTNVRKKRFNNRS